jgi:hypothetical protein
MGAFLLTQKPGYPLQFLKKRLRRFSAVFPLLSLARVKNAVRLRRAVPFTGKTYHRSAVSGNASPNGGALSRFDDFPVFAKNFQIPLTSAPAL